MWFFLSVIWKHPRNCIYHTFWSKYTITIIIIIILLLLKLQDCLNSTVCITIVAVKRSILVSVLYILYYISVYSTIFLPPSALISNIVSYDLLFVCHQPIFRTYLNKTNKKGKFGTTDRSGTRVRDIKSHG